VKLIVSVLALAFGSLRIMPRNVNHSICGCSAKEAAASATSLHFLPTLLSLIIPLSFFCQTGAEIHYLM